MSITKFIRTLCVLVLLAASLLPLSANDERVFFECPCSLEFDGEDSFTLSAGFRNFSNVDLEDMEVQIVLQNRRWFWNWNAVLAKIDIDEILPTGGALTEGSFEQSTKYDVSQDGEYYVLLRLLDKNGVWRDSIFMKEKVSPSDEFEIFFLDYLIDTDEDGASDLNEELEGTDPNDVNSVPPDTVIDVVGLYGKSFADEYDGDATTRIQHLFALANQILDDSDLPIEWRIVGTVEVEMDDQTTSLDDIDDLEFEGERHGSDLAVLFGPFPEKGGYCGFAGVYGWGRRGEMSEVDLTYALATVVGSCGAVTLAHELGHLMGLHHAVWQNSVGAWRWSRGHGVTDVFNTVMSYGVGGVPEDVFSDPDADCGSEDSPCGEAHDHTEAADAVASLNAVRFHYARARESFPDSDGDGFVDPVDDLPEDGTEWVDTDGDGIGNNADEDDDNDGVPDVDDAFPLDETEFLDSDDDGVGDFSDAFPNDPLEWEDSDNDGVGDNSDVFPLDSSEWADTDSDGWGDNSDAFPEDSTEWLDTDGDGVGNNTDTDDDGDRIPDIDDAYPLDESLIAFYSYKFVLESDSDSASCAIGFSARSDDPVDSHILIGVPQLSNGDANTGGAYVVFFDELQDLDAADGIEDHVVELSHVVNSSQSWKLFGTADRSLAGQAVSVGDIDGDGNTDLVVGVPREEHGGTRSGSLYIIPFQNLEEIDNDLDRVVSLDSSELGEFGWRIDGQPYQELGLEDQIEVGDVDNDGFDDLFVSTRRITLTQSDSDLRSAAYYLPGSRLEAMDEADGAQDRIIDVFEALGTNDSRLFVSASGWVGDRASVDMSERSDENDTVDLLIGTSRSLNNERNGSAFLLAGSQLLEVDGADGEEDGRINLANVASQQDSWHITGGSGSRMGSFATMIDDYTGDGEPDLGMSGWASYSYVASQDLETIDENDGSLDGNVSLNWALRTGNSFWVHYANPIGRMASTSRAVVVSSGTAYTTYGVFHITSQDLLSIAREPTNWQYAGVNAHGDFKLRSQMLLPHRPLLWLGTDVDFYSSIDGDEDEELLLVAPGDSRDRHAESAVYLVSTRDLDSIEQRDGEDDNLFRIEEFWGDSDKDGIRNFSDPDDDNDFIYDTKDEFHLDDSEWEDSDRDGFGDNIDAFPRNSREYIDTDADGLGDDFEDQDDDNDGILDGDDEYPLDTDNDGIDNILDPDDDNDEVLDGDDAFPLDANETSDWDLDGIGDNADTDDDNDGVVDTQDAFPFDSTETVDSDGDGVGDNGDVFPNDPEEWTDTDGDGTGNNADTDDDDDGVPDVDDDFPLDATRYLDSDGDGVADDDDAFPNDSSEWNDLDGDGIGDNSDPDLDGDGAVNENDEFPMDGTRVDLLSVKFVPWSSGADIGAQAGSSGDTDGDGLQDILLSGQTTDEMYEIYLVSSSKLVTADAADGTLDGTVNARYITDVLDSWKIEVPEEDDDGVVRLLRVGAITDNQEDSFLVSTSAGIYSDAYVIAPADISALDEDDDSADSVVKLNDLIEYANTWKFVGGWAHGLGSSASYIADIDGDDRPDICIGAPTQGAGNRGGSVFLASSSSLEALDARSGLDGTIYLESLLNDYSALDEEDRVWSFSGENPRDRAGEAVSTGDFDKDGLSDIAIGAPRHDSNENDDGAVYLVASTDWDAVDAADNVSDRQGNLASVASQPNSWKFIGEGPNKQLGTSVEIANLNEDSVNDLIVVQHGYIDVIAESDFAVLDQADGVEDGIIVVRGPEDTEDSWRFVCPGNWSGCSVSVVDGSPSSTTRSVLIGKRGYSREFTVAYVVAWEDFARLDELDGEEDRVLHLSHVSDLSHSYVFESRRFSSFYVATSSADSGDVDGDELSDLLFTIRDSYWNSSEPSETYVICSAELEYLDEMDGSIDRTISLERVTSRIRKSNDLAE